ncbi:hypothetical protein SRABI128_06306 [Microbacterium sp. Bi128]|nr:hypothetical protein SRABI128_06306 [Microbacterium sp. Bi128]
MPPARPTCLASATDPKASSSSDSKVHCDAVVQSSGAPTPATRCGQSRPSEIGRRMSGGDACAIVDPSMNSTIECTMDCGCTTTSMRSYGTSKSRCASMTSRPLFTRVAELVVTTRPMSHVGCASAWAGVTSASSARERPRNGPPDAVSTSRRTSCGSPERSACAIAECSESTGTICPGAARRVTRSPPTINDSLLASASVRPSSSAASVGPSPTEPVMPLSTTSASTSRTSCSASVAPRAIASTPNSAACASTPARSRPAASPTTSNRSGVARMTSSAWVPIEPVEPRMRTRRIRSAY